MPVAGPVPAPARLDRESALEAAAAQPLDVLVVGGGITGAGIALDAVTRGYRVALVERDDLASGTSSRSSKLVHGGVRYLATGDVRMVAEAVRERDRLRRLAPHLVRPLGFVVPVAGPAARAQLKAGMGLYDALARGRNVRPHQRLSADAVTDAAPGLARRERHGGYRYYDCQTDDARLTLQVARTARDHGALVANHAEVVGLLRARDGRVVGATVADRLAGTAHELVARWVVSAAGVWADRVRGLAAGAGGERLLPAKGIHLTFPRSLVAVDQAVVVPSGAGDGRRNFVIPWGDQVYVGTTDDAWNGDLDRPDVDGPDADYLLASVNAAFGTELSAADAVAAWAGLRPLVSGAAAASSDLSRRHAIAEDPPGLVTVTGGKLTTYRQMAEEAVDVVAAADGNRTPCVTARLPLGARGTAEEGLARTRAVCATLGVDAAVAGSLYHRHGDRAPEVLSACLEDDAGAAPLVPGLPYLRGEVRWAVRHELARTVEDVLQRRMRVALRDAAAGGTAVAWVADVLAHELGWDVGERERRIGDYLAGVARERGPVPLDTAWRGGAIVTP